MEGSIFLFEVSGEAEEIADVLNAGLFAPILDQWHPGQPHLAGFVMRRPDSDNASGAVANITALAAAGYRSQVGQVSELTGLEVTDAGLPAVLQAMLGGGLNTARIVQDTQIIAVGFGHALKLVGWCRGASCGSVRRMTPNRAGWHTGIFPHH